MHQFGFEHATRRRHDRRERFFEDEPAEGTRIDFENPASFDRLEFSCLGDVVMDLAVIAKSTDETTKSRIEELRCDESPHTLERALGSSSLGSLGADAYGSSKQSGRLLVAYSSD